MTTKFSTAKICRNCGSALDSPVLDLGKMPLANSNVKPENLNRTEPAFPLRIFFCESCGLVQQLDFVAAEDVFDEYQYFSSFSKSWLYHAKRYVETITKRIGLTEKSQVIEIASNDGYLLQYFKEKNIPALGIEPSKTVAEAALAAGIPTRIQFFNTKTAGDLAGEGLQADLILGNNVLAHVPDLHDFVEGIRIALKPGGVLTMEFPHLLRLLEQTQFDTIYHEHFSYFSFTAVERVFARHRITLFDVEELPTHGGSLRIYGRHQTNLELPVSANVAALKKREEAAGLHLVRTYLNLAKRVERVKEELLRFLKDAKARQMTVVGYGAPAKGNTFLNTCGVGPDLIQYTVDLSPHKQGLRLPGSHLPIYSPDKIRETKPNYVLILPWNLKDEITKQMSYISEWGGKFVTAIPELRVIEPIAIKESLVGTKAVGV